MRGTAALRVTAVVLLLLALLAVILWVWRLATPAPGDYVHRWRRV